MIDIPGRTLWISWITRKRLAADRKTELCDQNMPKDVHAFYSSLYYSFRLALKAFKYFLYHETK